MLIQHQFNCYRRKVRVTNNDIASLYKLTTDCASSSSLSLPFTTFPQLKTTNNLINQSKPLSIKMEHFTHIPYDFARRNAAFDIRLRTAMHARDFTYSGDDGHVTNGDEARFPYSLLGTFTKGLPHARDTSLLLHRPDFDLFVNAIDTGRASVIHALPLGPDPAGDNAFNNSAMAAGVDVRGWESMAAGLSFTLEGPDAQRVTMPPAPQIDSVELGYELTESYWMALCRDVPFTQFANSQLVADAATSMAAHKWLSQDDDDLNNQLTSAERHRRSLELRNGQGVSNDTVFRGVLNGDAVGPYISQFLLIGCDTLGGPSRSHSAAYVTGKIRYGSHHIDQRVRRATPLRDYMTSWGAYIDVTNGADVRGRESYVSTTGRNIDQDMAETHTFIQTPRDLATFVHYDALYQAYFNACVLMLAMGIEFDRGLPFTGPDASDKQTGFVLFGEPHILSLLVEVVHKSLKAVRYQKFNTHRRARPETVAAWVDCVQRPRRSPCLPIAASETGNDLAAVFKPIEKLCQYIDDDVLKRIQQHNAVQNDTQADGDENMLRKYDFDPVADSDAEHVATCLLPMAFAEGSPMHPAYGAGHATVAGACTTILKAFFNTDDTLPFTFVPTNDGAELALIDMNEPLTVEGELNKLCSNISIGRDWAGVHWRSDYTESIKLGEEVALALLREQKNVYVEQFTMTIPLFDGSVITI